VTSRRDREDGIPVWLCSDDFAVGRRPTFDQHFREGELAQRMSEKEQVAEKAGTGKSQARQALVRHGVESAGAKTEDGGRGEAEYRGKRAESGGAEGISHGGKVHAAPQGSPEKGLKNF